MQATKNLWCRMFGHHRSRERAFLEPESQRWKSYCSRCGAPMRKEFDGTWIEWDWD